MEEHERARETALEERRAKIRRGVEQELAHPRQRVELPLVPAARPHIRPVTNDESLFS